MLGNALYERQDLIEDLDIPKVATVIGVGGTGFWTAVFLAMSGVEEIILVDKDMVEASNLNRLPLKDSLIGVKKINAASDFISQIRSPIRIEAHDMRIEKPQDCTALRGIVFCCTDNLKSQQIVCAYCKKNNIPYQRIGYDGTTLNVSKAFPLSFKEEAEETGYSVTPSWVIPAVFAAAAGVSSKLYKELCLMDDIGKVNIQNSSFVTEGILDEAKEEEREDILENIHDYIPDSYGLCEDCNRIDPDNSDYGYCPDCEEHYSDDDIEEIKEKARNEEFDRVIEQIETGEISDPKLEQAIKKWQKTRGEK